MSSSETDSLSGLEQFMLISGGTAAAGACLGMILQFVLRSRCTTITNAESEIRAPRALTLLRERAAITS
eukprot:227551-Prymnesium_polylepis.1